MKHSTTNRTPQGRPSRPRRSGEVWAHAASSFTRWADGDPSGLDDLVKVMSPVLWQVVRAHRLPSDLAEDVVQTTWLALVKCRDSVEDPVAVGAWLTTTARREAWRVSKVTGRDTPVEDEDLVLALPDTESAESAAVDLDEQRSLWRVVDSLPLRCRQLLRIVAFEHRPDYQQLAVELGMPVGSIGPTRGRCLAKLRTALVQAGVHDE